MTRPRRTGKPAMPIRPSRRRPVLLLALALLAAAPGPRAAPPPPPDAPAPTLAFVDDGRADPARHWVSEKLDGVRALWDGERLRTRSGREIAAPPWFTAALPPRALDGELWMGRGRFEAVSAAVRREPPQDAEWREIRYMLFELPGAPGGFTDRIAAMRELVAAAGVPWLQAVEQFRVADRTELERRLREVLRAGGEGLMLHAADAPWTAGRSEALLKLKAHDDAEARVVAHLPGRGRHAGRLGALLVELPDGRRLRLGSGFSDAERERPPAFGATVTYRHRGLTASGLPRFASFLRERPPE